MSSKTVLVLAAILVLHHQASAQSDGTPCVSPRGEHGVCQKLITCQPLVQLLRRYGNEVGEYLRQSQCFYDGRDPYVCCPNTINNDDNNYKNNNNMNNNNNNNNNNQNNNNNNNNNNQIKPVTPPTATSSYGPLLPPVCGTTDAKYTRIVGGVPAKLGQWPWITALGYRGRQNPNKPRWLCGGSLISARHVLTAAHCVYRRDDLFIVRIGDLDLEDDYDGATPIDAPIERRNIHPQYSPSDYTNDIAILKLQFDIQFGPLVRPLCLPVTDSIRHKNLEGSFPFLVGWGTVYFNGPSKTQLQQIQVPIVSQEQCRQAFRNFKTATIDGRVLCAGYARGGKDACQGDSGGPLMYPIGKNFYAIGVVSYGFRCAEPGYPGVYTNTTSFLDFIIPRLN